MQNKYSKNQIKPRNHFTVKKYKLKTENVILPFNHTET